jgi:hypothetical protein
MNRRDLIEERVDKLAGAFEHYVQVHDVQVPFTSEQLAAHRACIALRLQAGSVRAAVSDERFVRALRRTLRAWGIGVRASRLVPDEDFTSALFNALPSLEALELLAIDASSLPGDVGGRIWHLIESLRVVENKAKIVAGTKTLHHLLPDLVVPMDRAWTGTFFQFHLPEWQDPASQRRIFELAFTHFVTVARRAQPAQYVTGQGWRTSRSKVIDNALIGYCKAELGEKLPASEDAVDQVSFDVAGYPPIKNEALSMLSVNHPYAGRVKALLEAAEQARQAQGFVPVDAGPIALDVVVRAPSGQNPADATNYLGGIGDVLQDKSSHGLPDSLGHSKASGSTATTGRSSRSPIVRSSPFRSDIPSRSEPSTRADRKRHRHPDQPAGPTPTRVFDRPVRPNPKACPRYFELLL